MKQAIPVARITDYIPGIPLITVDRICDIDESSKENQYIKQNGDKCLITITTERSLKPYPEKSLKPYIERELIQYIKAMYFRKVFGCKFEIIYDYTPVNK